MVKTIKEIEKIVNREIQKVININDKIKAELIREDRNLSKEERDKLLLIKKNN